MQGGREQQRLVHIRRSKTLSHGRILSPNTLWKSCHVWCLGGIYSDSPLVLLCYKNWRRQQGHLGRERARWVAIWRRRVAMECGVCRSVLIGSATRFRPVWQAG